MYGLKMIRRTIQQLCDNFSATYNSSYPVNVLWDSFLEICNACLDLQEVFHIAIDNHGLLVTSNDFQGRNSRGTTEPALLTSHLTGSNNNIKKKCVKSATLHIKTM